MCPNLSICNGSYIIITLGIRFIYLLCPAQIVVRYRFELVFVVFLLSEQNPKLSVVISAVVKVSDCYAKNRGSNLE